MVVVNLSQFKKKSILIKEWSEVRVFGKDAKNFLQGQLSIDINELTTSLARIAARLDRAARIQFVFLIYKKEDSFSLFIGKEFANGLVDDLGKFVISEDVEFEIAEEQQIFAVDVELLRPNHKILFSFIHFGKVFYAIEGDAQLFFEEIVPDDFNNFLQVNLNDEGNRGVLVTESPLVASGVSVDKGCYLGQETASKLIVRGRKCFTDRFMLMTDTNLAISESIFEIEKNVSNTSKNILVKLKKDISSDSALEFLNKNNIKYEHYTSERINELNIYRNHLNSVLDLAFVRFHGDDYENCLHLTELLVKSQFLSDELFELQSQCYYLMKNYDKAILVMDDLLKFNPHSNMAHTNKSVYYLAMGDIEKAEEEKALAAQSGLSASKLDEDETSRLIYQDQDRRLGMFKEVLEIDPEDEMALRGCVDIFKARKQYKSVVPYLEKLSLLKTNKSLKVELLDSYFLAGLRSEFLQLHNELKKIAADSGDKSLEQTLNNYK